MKLNNLLSTALLLAFCLTTLNAQMTVGSMVIGQGVTAPRDWQNYNNGLTVQGIYVDVNTSGCNFPSTPHYLVTLESTTNNGFHWEVSGVPSIYAPTPNGFRVYLRWTSHPNDEPTIGSLNLPNPLRAADATNLGWVIRWTGIVTGDCESCGIASFLGESGHSEIDESPVQMDFGSPNFTENDVNLFPNPSQTEITIKSSKNITNCELYNLNGQLLMKTTEKTIDISTLPNGDYLVKVYFGKEAVTKRFVKME